MTWSVGVLCPRCFTTFVRHQCKEKLPCGCEVKTENAYHLFKWMHNGGVETSIGFQFNGEVYEISGFNRGNFSEVKAAFEKKVEDWITSHDPGDQVRPFLQHCIKQLVGGGVMVHDGYDPWPARCRKCLRVKCNPEDGSPLFREPCEQGHKWKSVECADFKLNLKDVSREVGR